MRLNEIKSQGDNDARIKELLSGSAKIVQHWKKVFDQVNKDDPDNFVPFSDVEYYAQQVHNLTDERDVDAAHKVAVKLSKLS